MYIHHAHPHICATIYIGCQRITQLLTQQGNKYTPTAHDTTPRCLAAMPPRRIRPKVIRLLKQATSPITKHFHIAHELAYTLTPFWGRSPSRLGGRRIILCCRSVGEIGKWDTGCVIGTMLSGINTIPTESVFMNLLSLLITHHLAAI